METNLQSVKLAVELMESIQTGEKILVRNKDFIYHLAEVITMDEKLEYTTLEVKFCGSRNVITTFRSLVLDPKEWLTKHRPVFLRANPGRMPEVYESGEISEVLEQGLGEPARFSVRIKDQTKYFNMEDMGINHTTVLEELRRRKNRVVQWRIIRWYVAVWLAILLVCFSGWTGIEWHAVYVQIAVWICFICTLILSLVLCCIEPLG